MPQRGLTRPLVVLALPGMYLLYKYNQYRQQQMEVARRRVTERELLHLNTKICADIVMILESGALRVDAPYRERFQQQAPLVRHYANSIAGCCPDAWVLVAATPTDCMVPLMAEVFRNNSYYNRRRLIGSMALPEMRARTIAARALHLEPKYIRVPCVGGSEGRALVPLFSNTVEMFDFDRKTEDHLTSTLRDLTRSVARFHGACQRSAELSEAYAQARLVCAVAQALTCRYVPTVHGFVEIDHNEIVSPSRYVATKLELVGTGVRTVYPFPRMNDYEFRAMNVAALELQEKMHLVEAYCGTDLCGELRLDQRRCGSSLGQ